MATSSYCLLRDACMSVRYVHSMGLDVMQAFVGVDARGSFASEKLNRFESSPGCEFLREVPASCISREAEDAAWPSEDVYLHLFVRKLWIEAFAVPPFLQFRR